MMTFYIKKKVRHNLNTYYFNNNVLNKFFYLSIEICSYYTVIMNWYIYLIYTYYQLIEDFKLCFCYLAMSIKL